MALRNSAGSTSTPAFEPEESFETMAAETPAPAERQPAQERKPEPQARTTAVAPAKTTAVAAPKKLSAAYAEYENVISIEDVASMGVGAFPRVTVDVGGFSLDDKDLGKEIHVKLMSWNNRYMIVPGAKDEESKKLVKISYDNQTIEESGESVRDYLAHLKVEGYAEAKSKQYVDLWGAMTFANGAEIPEEDRKIVQVQLSPQSVKQFKAFQVQVGWNQVQGMTKDTTEIFMRAEKKELAGDRFGIVKFDLK